MAFFCRVAAGFFSIDRIAMLIGGCVFLAVGGSMEPVYGQTLHGTAQLTATAGHQTNPYTDPMLRIWDPAVTPTFAGAMPEGMLSWKSSAFRAHVRTTARFEARGRASEGNTSSVVPLLQATSQGLHALGESVEVGLNAGLRRYQLQTSQDGAWVLPMVQWRATRAIRIDGYAGWSGRRYRGDVTEAASGWTSTFTAQSAVHWWMQNNIRTTIRLYRSQPASASSMGTGTGGSAAVTWWPTSAWSVTVDGQIDQSSYTVSSDEERASHNVEQGTATAQFAQVGTEVTWRPSEPLEAFVQASVLHPFVDNNDQSTGHHAGIGVRLRHQSVLAESSSALAAQDPLWHVEDNGHTVHLSVPASSEKQLYITGDFNDWALPGQPLTPTHSNDRHNTTLSLSPGRYAYRIHKVDDENGWNTESTPNWIDLPDGAITEEDSFGGINGVIIVDP